MLQASSPDMEWIETDCRRTGYVETIFGRKCFIPGFIRDHERPLACGGPDAVDNMQWQSVAAARAKDRWERQACGR